jgi:hypothetical protein
MQLLTAHRAIKEPFFFFLIKTSQRRLSAYGDLTFGEILLAIWKNPLLVEPLHHLALPLSCRLS